MSVDDNPAPSTARPWRKMAAIALAATIVAGLSYVGLQWAYGPDQSEKSVSTQWNEAVRRLGIDPVYPPQEDLAVGDVMALVTSDALEDVRQEPLAGRAIKIWHLDLTRDIEDASKQTYRFGESPPAGTGGLSQTLWSPFKIGDIRAELPIVIFPAFTIAKLNAASGAGRLTTLFEGMFGGSASSNVSADIKISSAQTYGIDALTAEGRLYQFCSDAAKAPVCTANGMRRQLSMIVGSKINEKVKDQKTGQEMFRLGVELALINRVYLASSIETTITRQQALSAGARGQKDGAETAASTPAGPVKTAPAQSPAGEAAPGGVPETMQQKIDEQKARIDELEAHLSSAAGISTVIEKADGSSIRVKEVTKRPVVIGFRSVRWRAD